MYKRMQYEEMRLKSTGEIVQVYAVDWENNSAVIFCEEHYQRLNNGWTKVKLSKLVPLDIPEVNKAKRKIKLLDATWETSDGGLWKNADIDNAIEHEIFLMDLERSRTERQRAGDIYE